jgi:endonuclease YncB( thermonuclease family)
VNAWLLAAALLGSGQGLVPFAGRVVAITDGDTLTVLDGENRQHRLRLAEIDAPERGQPFGTAARARLAGLVFGEQVEFLVHSIDRYGREVATVRKPGGDPGADTVNLEMVRSGYAWAYTGYAKDPRTRLAEAEARSAGSGLWSGPAPVPPWEWRRAKKQPGPEKRRSARVSKVG